jgi:carboxypeptidase C (cathepsin A)
MNKSSTIPLILWLQGGPGSSSQFGAYTEIGPIVVEKEKPKLRNQLNSWNREAHLLFVDSPLNTGFSYHGDRVGKTQVNTTSIATNHLLNFLYNFYKEFPSLKSSRLYIAGESYAGHYIPSLTNKIFFNMTFVEETDIRLAGIMIGNGFVDPINQINYYDSYLRVAGII